MMSEKQLFLIIAIACLVLFIIFKLFYIEGFEDVNVPGSTVSPTQDPTATPPTILPSQELQNLCPQSNLDPWTMIPPKQIVSYISGVRFPVHAIKPSDGINSSFQIPFIKSGEVEASGCIVIENSGTYTTKMCNADSIEQRWKIIRIKDAEIFSTMLKAGNDYYSSGRTTNDLPQGVQFGFYMVVSEKDPSMVLASNGGNLTVQRIGNYTSQFWDITKDIGNANISIYDTVDYTSFSSNFTDPNNILNGGGSAGNMYKYPGAGKNSQTEGSNNQSITYNSLANPSINGGGLSSGTQPFNINLNLDKQSLMSLFGTVNTTGAGIPDTPFQPAGTPSPPEGFNPNPNPNCKPCPSILTDYISKNDIPCLGCKL